MAVSTRETSRTLWHLLFEFRGSIWCSVLPYCVLNCLIMILVEALVLWDVKIAFSPSGHGLMTLIVSFLVISKVNLAYERYMNSRQAIGHALAALRELNQAIIMYTLHLPPSDKLASKWRQESTSRILDLMDCTIRVIKNTHQANYLARNVDVEYKTDDDPMEHVQALRLHLYTVNKQALNTSCKDYCETRTHHNPKQLELFERTRMQDSLTDFVLNYRNLLKLASTPLPFPLVQMGRTFLFLWTFSIPLVLRGVVDEFVASIVFVFFLTYGFVGLELVAMKLMNPFGDGINDLNVTGMKEATTIGIEKDLRAFGEIQDKRLVFSRSKPRPPMKKIDIHNNTIKGYDDPHHVDNIEVDPNYTSDSHSNVYVSMHDVTYPPHA